jgi:hypothetical protein
MARIAKKYADRGHEDGPRLSTRSVNKSGVSKATRRIVRAYRKAGLRAEAKMDVKDRAR